jgi:putative ribosome biogenesis GTPase RsgA
MSDYEMKETRLVLIGRTGTGKSETGNKVLGDKVFKATVSGKSVTKTCSYRKGFNIGRNICVIDTPGLFDTGQNVELELE